MYELIRVSESCYYIDSPSKIGLVKISPDEVVLIDSANSRDVGKKIKRILEENNWTLRAIYNTHSHADHIGANCYLQNLTGCKVYAKGIERDFTNHPLLESFYVYGGYSSKELRHKFLLAEACEVDELTESSLPSCLRMISLPGHSFDMVGFITDEGIAYIGDAYSSELTLEKYGIGFIHDVGAYIKTLEDIKNIDARLFVPAHAEPTDNPSELADLNKERVFDIIRKILEFTAEPIVFEELLKKLFDAYSMTLGFEQYALVGSTVRSYLSYLRDKNELEVSFLDNRMYWIRKKGMNKEINNERSKGTF